MIQLGPHGIGNPVFLAPMECYTNAPYRRLAREMGACWATTEMARAEAVIRRIPSTMNLLAKAPGEGGPAAPLAGQIVGSSPAVMAEAARVIEGLGLDAVDLNFGCPSRRVRSEEAGGFLLLHPERIGAIVEAVVNTVKVPVTVKMRCGFDEERVTIAQVVRAAESAGAAAVAIHARTVKQGYAGSGRSLWHRVGEAKAAVRIPVLGNGDIRSGADLEAIRKETGCDGVLVARASMGNPWIFRELRADGAAAPPLPSREEVLAVMDRHLALLEESLPPRAAAHLFALHGYGYAKRMILPTAFRRALSRRWLPPELRQLFLGWPESAGRFGIDLQAKAA